jgi:hypothetical protein
MQEYFATKLAKIAPKLDTELVTALANECTSLRFVVNDITPTAFWEKIIEIVGYNANCNKYDIAKIRTMLKKTAIETYTGFLSEDAVTQMNSTLPTGMVFYTVKKQYADSKGNYAETLTVYEFHDLGEKLFQSTDWKTALEKFHSIYGVRKLAKIQRMRMLEAALAI